MVYVDKALKSMQMSAIIRKGKGGTGVGGGGPDAHRHKASITNITTKVEHY
jgi:hypothetical protein